MKVKMKFLRNKSSTSVRSQTAAAQPGFRPMRSPVYCLKTNDSIIATQVEFRHKVQKPSPVQRHERSMYSVVGTWIMVISSALASRILWHEARVFVHDHQAYS